MYLYGFARIFFAEVTCSYKCALNVFLKLGLVRNSPRCLQGLEIKDNWEIYNIFSEIMSKGKSQLSLLALIGSILNFYQNEQQANEKYDENIR